MDSLAVIRCPVCRCESGAQYLFCGMCGARLYRPETPAAAPQPPTQSPAQPPVQPPVSKPAEPPLRVDRVSLLGLDGEPFSGPPRTGRADYLLEETVEPPSRRARMHLALALLVVAGVVIAFQWHQYGYPWIPHFDQHPAQNQSVPAQSVSTDTGAPAPVDQSKPSPDTPMQPSPSAPVASNTTGNTPAAGSSAAGSAEPQSPGSPALPNAEAAGANSPAAPGMNPQDKALQSPVSQNQDSAAPASPDQAPQAQGSQAKDSQERTAGSPDTQAQAVPPRQSEQAAARKAPAASLVTRPGPDKTELMSVASSQTEAETAPAAPSEDQLIAEGEKYLYGNGVPQDCARAQSKLEAAAAHNAIAQSLLGTMYASGHCVPRDLPTAYRWYVRALREDPANTRIETDLKVLWSQMTPAERQLVGGK